MFQLETAELRQLNRRLQQEIAERKKVEKDLEVAEQTVAQTSSASPVVGSSISRAVPVASKVSACLRERA